MGKKQIKWAVADSETNPFRYGDEIKPFIWGVIDSDGGRHIFRYTEDFIEWAENFEGYIYAHNGGRFDWLMSEILVAIKIGSPIKIINSRLAEAKLGRATLRDSFLCCPASLAKVTGAKLDFDYDKMSIEKRHAHMAEIEAYLMQDCAALFSLMERFITEHGFKLTQAGAALASWEAMGGAKRRYGIEHDAMFRPFYFGGRVEVFEYGAPLIGEFNAYDVNSAYPAAMMQELPLGDFSSYITTGNIKKINGASFGIIQAISKGALPFRDESGAVRFPKDKSPREYRVTGWEIIAGLETKTLDVIDGVYYVPRRTETMKPYVDFYGNRKIAAEKAGDKIGREMAKIFLNSCYGKYGSNPDEYKDYMTYPIGKERPEVEKTRWGREVRPWVIHLQGAHYDILERDAANKQYYDVALAASITGHARAQLWRAISGATRPIYCDTDSLLCESADVELHPTKFGAWKNEGKFSEAWIAGKKLYAFKHADGSGYKTASKGVKATVEEIKRAARGEIVEVKRDAPVFKITGEQIPLKRQIKIT